MSSNGKWQNRIVRTAMVPPDQLLENPHTDAENDIIVLENRNRSGVVTTLRRGTSDLTWRSSMPLDSTPCEWKDIPGYEGIYQVSNTGQVKRLAGSYNTLVDRIISQTIMPTGYHVVSLSKANRGRSFLVHRLVALAFIGPVPERHEVNHIDGNKHNNCLSNLEYLTRSQNQLHASALGIAHRGELNSQSRLTEAAVREIRKRHAAGEGYKRLGVAYDVTWSNIRNIVKRKTWRHVA